MELLYALFIAPIEAILHLVLSVSYTMTGHYGVSILILSLCVNVALLPLYHIAEKWQQAERDMQSRLRPKLQEFQEAFSGEERFMMVRTLYRQAGYHPIYAVRSSLGLLIQVPFFIAAYHFLSHYQPLQGVSAFRFEDLSKPDALLWGINVMPFVMTFVNLFSAYVYAQRLSRSEIIQLWLISFLFLVLLYSSAVALLLYWTFNNLFSLVKNMAYARLTLSPTTGVRQVGASISSLQKTPAFQPSAYSSHASCEGSAGKEGGRTILLPLAEILGEFARFIPLPTSFNFALFLVVVAVQAALVMNFPSSEDRGGDQSGVVAILAIGASIVIFAYLCLAFSLKAYEESRAVAPGAGFRLEANIVLVWLLFAMFVVVHGGWLVGLYPHMRPTRIGGILLMFSFLMFASPFCGSIRILRTMSDSHSLYIISTCLLAMTVFVANPISLYVYSGDFPGGVYGIVGVQLAYFVVAVLAFTTLYLLADHPVRKCLTLLSVFSALSVIAYSAMGVKRAGLMVQFEVFWAPALIRTNWEILTEVAILLALFGATTYVTLYYRQGVTQVASVTLCASLCVAAIDAYKGNTNTVEVYSGLPVDHRDIIGFSRERNVLLILLDGFSGGYIQTIMNEAPDLLRDYDGFVWYPNMLTAHAGTIGSISSLAGGHQYTVQQINNGNYGSIGNAIKDAYTVYPDAFIPKGYQVTYVYHPYFNNGCESIDKRVLCTDTVPYLTYYHDKEEPDAPLWDEAYAYSDLPPILSMVSVFKASPFFLKHWIYSHGSYLGALPATVRTGRANSFKMRDWGFLRVLARESNADSKWKTFKFIHLEIPHPPYALSDDCRLLPPRATVATEMVCALKEIGVLLSWLKKNGIYDATKIVLVSDHGWYVENPMFPTDFLKTVPLSTLVRGVTSRKVTGWVQSLLLVKDFNAKGKISRSDTFLATPDVPSILCATVGGCRGVGSNPITNDLGDRVLTFVNTDFNVLQEKAPRFDITEGYEVRNNIFDARNWTRIK